MVLDHEFPPDERVEKEALSLIQAGHEVHIATYSRSHAYKSIEKYKKIIIHRKYISPFIYKSSAAILVLPFYFHYWKKYLADLLNLEHFDAIHIHDLPLCKLGYIFKKRYNLLMICDQHEYYSNWIVKTAHYNTISGKLIKLLSPWKSYEKKYLSKADAVITVEEPLKEIYITKVGIKPDKIFCVSNTPLQSLFNQANVKVDITDMYSDFFTILYVGGMDILRGIDVAIKSLKYLKDKIPNVKLLLIGNESKYFDMRSLIEKEDVSKLVEFVPFQDISMLPSYISAADICFFTPQTNRTEIHHTIATKIYQYIAMGRPVIVSNAKMMAEFIEKNKLGFVINEKDENEFAEKVLMIANEPTLSIKFRKNALDISNQFFWEQTVLPLIDFYNQQTK